MQSYTTVLRASRKFLNLSVVAVYDKNEQKSREAPIAEAVCLFCRVHGSEIPDPLALTLVTLHSPVVVFIAVQKKKIDNLCSRRYAGVCGHTCQAIAEGFGLRRSFSDVRSNSTDEKSSSRESILVSIPCPLPESWAQSYPNSGINQQIPRKKFHSLERRRNATCYH